MKQLDKEKKLIGNAFVKLLYGMQSLDLVPSM